MAGKKGMKDRDIRLLALEARALSDPHFRQRFIDDAAKAAGEMGITLNRREKMIALAKRKALQDTARRLPDHGISGTMVMKLVQISPPTPPPPEPQPIGGKFGKLGQKTPK